MLEWRPDPHPYAGDPYGYLLAAREDKWFYDAHVREPLFVFATKGLLHLTGGHDIAVNIASVAFSTLAVVGTYLLGAATFTPVVGVAAASLLTIERQSLALSAEGWRDDLFTCLVVLFALAVVRLRGRPTFGRGLVAGLAGGLACLTRVTAFSFLLPAYAWLVMRGIVTLPMRVEKHSRNALEVARFLESHERVTQVRYPGLPSHPHHEVAKKQMSGFSGMMNFALDCELLENLEFIKNLQLITHAVSLGHDQSLIFYLPTAFFFQDMVELSEKKKMKYWSLMGDGVFRFSVGIENPADIIEDLARALDSLAG
jgi:hypothetical protein